MKNRIIDFLIGKNEDFNCAKKGILRRNRRIFLLILGVICVLLGYQQIPEDDRAEEWFKEDDINELRLLREYKAKYKGEMPKLYVEREFELIERLQRYGTRIDD